jgi:hypothetical protein
MVAVTRSASRLTLRTRGIEGARRAPLRELLARGLPRELLARGPPRARQPRRVAESVQLLVPRPAFAVKKQEANAAEWETVGPETTIQPVHTSGFIARVAAAHMQAQAVASAAVRSARHARLDPWEALWNELQPQSQEEDQNVDPPAQHDDLLAEPAWDWEGYVRSMNDELGLPN